MFTFSLQSVLNYRKALEEKKLLEFFIEQRRLAKEKEQLESMRYEEAMLLQELRHMQIAVLDTSEIALYLSYIKIIKEKEHVQESVVNKASEEVETKKVALIAAVKDRKIMDVLRGKKFQEYKETTAAFERKTNDETAGLRFVRKER